MTRARRELMLSTVFFDFFAATIVNSASLSCKTKKRRKKWAQRRTGTCARLSQDNTRQPQCTKPPSIIVGESKNHRRKLRKTRDGHTSRTQETIHNKIDGNADAKQTIRVAANRHKTRKGEWREWGAYQKVRCSLVVFCAADCSVRFSTTQNILPTRRPKNGKIQ